MLTALIVLASIAQLVLALFVYLKGRNNLTNTVFSLVILAALAWTLSNYASVTLGDSPNVIYAVRMILFCVVFLNAFFYMFARTFPNAAWKHSKNWLVLYGLFTLVAASATLTPYVFTSVDVQNGIPVTVAGPGIAVFITHAAISVTVAFKVLFRKARRATGSQKNQLQLLLLASVFIWIISPITNFAITPLLQTTFFIVISPLYILAFTAIIAYAIISQKLFDIRAAAARALAYILSLGTIILVYGGIVFGLTGRFFETTDHPTAERAFYIGLAIASSLAYPTIKRFFDKITNKVFFQDSYEPQVFLDELNEVLVVNIELEKLLTETVAVIEQNLKTNFCVFSIRETSYFPRRIIGDTKRRFDDKDIQEIGDISAHLHEKVIVADFLEENNRELKRTLDKNDVAVLVRLVTTLEYEVQGTGYILFGAKKSGNSYSKQDIQTLEIIANELVIAVQNGLRFEEIEKFNVTLQDKVDDATRQLRRTNDKLKAMDETKDEFISMASHQLRTPLTSVKGYLSMVLEGDAGEVTEMQRKLLDQAFTSSQRMVYLIADLLNVSRLRTGKFVIEAVATNLAEVVEGEVHQLIETAKARGLTLTYDKPAGFPSLMLDETKIRQVMMNFMDNAIYYAKPNGKVQVKLTETDKTIEYTVTDDGIGVPKSEQHHLFTKFYRAGNAKKARPDGTGLGLFMAKKVIVAQGGTLIFKSEEGKGSTFGFSFDKAKLQPPTDTNHRSD